MRVKSNLEWLYVKYFFNFESVNYSRSFHTHHLNFGRVVKKIMSLVLKKFIINETMSLDCWIYVIQRDGKNDEFWFKCSEIAKFLGYEKPIVNTISKNVKTGWQMFWCFLKELKSFGSTITPYDTISMTWENDTLFVAEPGLNALIMGSKKSEASSFLKWIYEDVLPSLKCDMLNEYAERYRDADELAHLKLDGLCGFVYLATTPTYREQKIYNIGFTSNVDRRLQTLNALRMPNDEFDFVKLWLCIDCRLKERLLFRSLARYRHIKDFFTFDSESKAIELIEQWIDL